MSGRSRSSTRIVGPDIDLAAEVILDSQGRRVDEEYVRRALDEVEEDIVRRAGRPSLTGAPRHSPHVTFRLTPELKSRAEREACERGVSVSQLARLALEQFIGSDTET